MQQRRCGCICGKIISVDGTVCNFWCSSAYIFFYNGCEYICVGFDLCMWHNNIKVSLLAYCFLLVLWLYESSQLTVPGFLWWLLKDFGWALWFWPYPQYILTAAAACVAVIDCAHVLVCLEFFMDYISHWPCGNSSMHGCDGVCGPVQNSQWAPCPRMYISNEYVCVPKTPYH